jgi:hypothetical protein
MEGMPSFLILIQYEYTVNLSFCNIMEEYRSGYNEPHSKCGS